MHKSRLYCHLSLVHKESMGEMDNGEEKRSSGCGLLLLYNSVFRRNGAAPRRSSSTNSMNPPPAPKLSPLNSRRRRAASEEDSMLVPVANPADLSIARSPFNAKPTTIAPTYQKASRKQQQGTPTSIMRMQSNGLTAELESIIHDHQRTKGSSTLVRASSGNVMLFGNLGNIRAPGAVTPNRSVLDHLPKTAKEMESNGNMMPGHRLSNEGRSATEEPASPGVLCRALSKRLEPEELKEMGNEEYKNGRYAEASAFYDRAILMNPGVASYYSNKAAALISLGQLLEAVGECREAIRIDPSYLRAHHRLATLYLRLGEAEKAINHYKLARTEATSKDISKAQAVQTHLFRCNEARKLRDWHTVLEEAESAVSAGADSAPQAFTSQAEALLRLQRHEEADSAFIDAPKFDIDASTRFFGASANAYQLAVQAQVDMAAGRFEDAVAVSQRASRLDPSSREVGAVARKARAVASARAKGNEFFKASKYEEACIAYGEGLDHDSENAILLCNRAACRSKLGQWEKAIEDCNAALNMRPSYSKARLRRVDCNAKLERWEASIRDYEALLQEMPGDEDLHRALLDAQTQIKKQKGEETKDIKQNADLVPITSTNQFRKIVSSPGLSVVLFCDEASDISREIITFMERFCKQYPSVNFLKVDVEENHDLADSESLSLVPAFKIYKNGSSLKDIGGFDRDQLESSIRRFSR